MPAPGTDVFASKTSASAPRRRASARRARRGPVPGLAAALFEEANFGDHHAAVGRLAHVVDRQQADLHRGQRFHLDAGAADGLDLRGAAHLAGGLDELELDADAGERDRVAERHQLGGPLRALDRRDAGNAEDVALGGTAGRDQRQRRRQHADCSGRPGEAMRLDLGGDVDHVRFALRIEVREGARVGGSGNHRRYKGEIFPLHDTRRRRGSPARPRSMSFVSPQTTIPRRAGRGWRQRALATVCALAVAVPSGWLPAAAQTALPALGDTDSAEFTVGTERKLGDQIMREIHVDPDYVDDPLLLEYVETVWDPLVAASRKLGNITADLDQRFAWQPFLVRDPSVNAFALPGGFVGVHLGLIALTTTRDELASVLGHEMSHVSQRHIARSITGDSRRSLVGLAALLLGLVAASRSRSPDAMSAVVAGTQAATIQGQLNFSRDVEREADRVGFQVMTAAGFAPGGMAAMFEKMDTLGAAERLRRLPVPADPPADGRAHRRGALAPAPEKRPRDGAAAVSVLEHTVAQARASVLMDPRIDALRRWQARDADSEGSAADKLRAACESALASSMLRDWARADAAFASRARRSRAAARTAAPAPSARSP